MSAMSQDHANAHLASASGQDAYRDYDKPGIDRVRTFYRNNHQQQTFAFVQQKKARWLQFKECSMTPWAGWTF
jgi:inositol oxygenase